MRSARFAVVTACISVIPALAGAAEPASGTITDSQTSVEWTGGPFVVPNVTPLLGLAEQEPVCEEGTPSCDVFRFEVNLTGANVEEDSVVITVGWEDAIPEPQPVIDNVGNTPDYDLYLYDDETGDLILDQASAANPEVITVGANNRKYRLVIIPFAAMNQPYAGKVEFQRFEEERTGVLGGALGAGMLLVLLGFGAALRRRA